MMIERTVRGAGRCYITTKALAQPPPAEDDEEDASQRTQSWATMVQIRHTDSFIVALDLYTLAFYVCFPRYLLSQNRWDRDRGGAPVRLLHTATYYNSQSYKTTFCRIFVHTLYLLSVPTKPLTAVSLFISFVKPYKTTFSRIFVIQYVGVRNERSIPYE